MLHDDLNIPNKADFLAKVQTISDSLGINPDWLMQIMYKESGISSTIQNPDTNATGLIQFMPSTAEGLGTTVEELAAMSNVEQLDYVYAYLNKVKESYGNFGSYLDLYLAVFFPAAIGKPLDTVLQAVNLPASVIARVNQGFDLNHDGKITLAEVQQVMLEGLPSSLIDEFKKKLQA